MGGLFTIAVLLTGFLSNRWWKRLNQPTVLCPGCNVIIIDIDTFRADAFDCKGKPGDSGYPPNLCEFVKDAFKFENNFSQYYWTRPSMVSTHTGLYPPEHGVDGYSEGYILPSNILTAPEVFQRNGYSTLRAGQMGDSYTISNESRTDRGYDLFYNDNDKEFKYGPLLINSMDFSVSPVYSFFYFGSLHSPYLLNPDNPVISSINRDPFFPITKEEMDKSFEEYLLNVFPGLAKRKVSFSDVFVKIYSRFVLSTYNTAIEKNASVANNIQLVYEANIKEFDKDIEIYLKSLEQLKEQGNSVIIFMSDHGEAFYEHGYFEHVTSPGSQYNEFIYVPLYIYVPGIKGRIISQISSNIDIFPTIFEIIGIDDSALINQGHGRSLVSLMDRRRLWGNLQDRFAISFSNSVVSIQNAKSKMIIDILNENRVEIYDLAKDPGEKNNIESNSESIKKYFMRQLKLVFGFNFKGLGLNWRERFGKSVN